MSKLFTNSDNWKYANLDIVDEILETNKKAIILISGASSSGKSYSAKQLQKLLEENGHNCVIISTDSYNKGISGIIVDKVNKNYFNNNLENIEEIKKIIKNIIINTDFSEKFCKNDLLKIKKQIKPLINKNKIDLFCACLQKEFSVINFDEPSVYELNKVARDVNYLINNKQIKQKKYSKIISEQLPRDTSINGQNYDVIIVEGIYALNDELCKNLPKNITIKNFVEGNAKSLFLRRVIRDAKSTSADNCFTIKSYFKYIVPSYLNTILPNKKNADIVFVNDMTFSELRQGDLYLTKEKIKITNKNLIQFLLKNGKVLSKEFQRDIYISAYDENISSDNLLRLRTISFDNGKTYTPTSLVHKGAPKTRLDGKQIRPINVLISEGDFEKIFSSEQQFLTNLYNAGFRQDRTTIKTRYRILISGQSITLDDIKNEGVFVELSQSTDKKFLDFVRQNANTKNSVYCHSETNHNPCYTESDYKVPTDECI